VENLILSVSIDHLSLPRNESAGDRSYVPITNLTQDQRSDRRRNMSAAKPAGVLLELG
jgi:hypothetical protein